jgi:uncharacterized FlaG/YvyC family protein
MTDLNSKIDDLEAATKKYASKDTVISIGGYEFTPAKLMVAATLVSSLLGGLYGTFEVYKDYQSMKKKIASYEAPDLSDFDKRLAVIEENSSKTTDYTRDIKNDLKTDIRRNESVTEQVERSVKQAQRETDQDLKAAVKNVDVAIQRSRDDMDKLKREIEARIDRLNKTVDDKIQKAIDNPLAGK